MIEPKELTPAEVAEELEDLAEIEEAFRNPPPKRSTVTLRRAAELLRGMGTLSAENMARMFHEIYEAEAPNYGYETRKDTRVFDPYTSNGRLMVVVCGKIRDRLYSGKAVP